MSGLVRPLPPSILKEQTVIKEEMRDIIKKKRPPWEAVCSATDQSWMLSPR